LAQEDGHELIHAGVGEQQVGRVGHEARRGHDGVLLRPEEVEKRLADFSGRHTKNGAQHRQQAPRKASGSFRCGATLN